MARIHSRIEGALEFKSRINVLKKIGERGKYIGYLLVYLLMKLVLYSYVLVIMTNVKKAFFCDKYYQECIT